jgi:hypothetical protein
MQHLRRWGLNNNRTMAILDKDRKHLWAKSGNRCAICKCELFHANPNCEDFSIGEECHIVSSQSNGPRHIDNWGCYDSYENLILLCRNHHKEIDDPANLSQYPASRLKEIKESHEVWVKSRLSQNSKSGGEKVPLVLYGTELANIISGVYATERDNDPFTSREEAEYIGEIWQQISTFIDYYSDLEPIEQAPEVWNLQEMLNGMIEKGYLLFGKRVSRKQLFKNGETGFWPVAILLIKKIENCPFLNENKVDGQP